MNSRILIAKIQEYYVYFWKRNCNIYIFCISQYNDFGKIIVILFNKLVETKPYCIILSILVTLLYSWMYDWVADMTEHVVLNKKYCFLIFSRFWNFATEFLENFEISSLLVVVSRPWINYYMDNKDWSTKGQLVNR